MILKYYVSGLVAQMIN